MRGVAAVIVALVVSFVADARADDSDRLLTIDHYVRVTSTVPAIAGTPAEVAFDVPSTRPAPGACSSHNAMWERNHLLLFRASLEWLTQGTVSGTKTGMLKLGNP